MPRVNFLTDDLSIEMDEGQSLSLAAQEVDSTLPFGCRAGTCGSCALTVLEGGEHLDAPGFVEADTLAVCGEDGAGRRLGCQILLRAGDVSVEW